MLCGLRSRNLSHVERRPRLWRHKKHILCSHRKRDSDTILWNQDWAYSWATIPNPYTSHAITRCCRRVASSHVHRNVPCRRTSHHRSQSVRANHASPMSAVVAASPQTSVFQDIHPCLSFVGWHRSCVPSWRMYAGYRRWPPSSAVCWQSNVLGQEITQPVRWPLFWHVAGPTLWKSLPEQLRQPDITFGQFKRSLKTFMFG